VAVDVNEDKICNEQWQTVSHFMLNMVLVPKVLYHTCQRDFKTMATLYEQYFRISCLVNHISMVAM
jgi:hypothetical protein